MYSRLDGHICTFQNYRPEEVFAKQLKVEVRLVNLEGLNLIAYIEQRFFTRYNMNRMSSDKFNNCCDSLDDVLNASFVTTKEFFNESRDEQCRRLTHMSPKKRNEFVKQIIADSETNDEKLRQLESAWWQMQAIKDETDNKDISEEEQKLMDTLDKKLTNALQGGDTRKRQKQMRSQTPLGLQRRASKDRKGDKDQNEIKEWGTPLDDSATEDGLFCTGELTKLLGDQETTDNCAALDVQRLENGIMSYIKTDPFMINKKYPCGTTVAAGNMLKRQYVRTQQTNETITAKENISKPLKVNDDDWERFLMYAPDETTTLLKHHLISWYMKKKDLVTKNKISAKMRDSSMFRLLGDCCSKYKSVVTEIKTVQTYGNNKTGKTIIMVYPENCSMALVDMLLASNHDTFMVFGLSNEKIVKYQLNKTSNEYQYHEYKDFKEAADEYNQPDNCDGKNVSLAIVDAEKYGEGRSFMDVGHVIVTGFPPGQVGSWTRLQQLIGRGVRMCSHKEYLSTGHCAPDRQEAASKAPLPQVKVQLFIAHLADWLLPQALGQVTNDKGRRLLPSRNCETTIKSQHTFDYAKVRQLKIDRQNENKLARKLHDKTFSLPALADKDLPG
jgi:hypothetical protein